MRIAIIKEIRERLSKNKLWKSYENDFNLKLENSSDIELINLLIFMVRKEK